MSKIYFQGTYGAYSHLASLAIDPLMQKLFHVKLLMNVF